MDDDILSMHLPQAEDEIIDMDLHDAIDQLAPYDKTLIILRFFEDLKIDEIATVMNDNINTIKSRLYRILNKLRIKVGEDFKV